ncbi:MAG: endonuclease/exonuclease/phosphatase family protein [Blastocatellales bacterium]
MSKQKFFLAIVMLCLMISLPVGQTGKVSNDVRVMSFNIRYGTAKDGDNHWDKRKDFLIETIKAFNPDLLGTQETLGFQRDYLAEKLSGYEVLGVGRDDGKEAGEMTALYFKRSRFEKLDGGHFWLSETPEVPGSKNWDAALTRMVSWVKLRDRRQPKAKPLIFLNTHFDHRGEQARAESAKLIRRKVEEFSATYRVIVTGDFNAGEDSAPYHALFAPSEAPPKSKASPVRDAFRLANPGHSANEGTFSSFKAGAVTGPRIDWIAVSREWQVVEAAIDRTQRDGRTPSDHFPVTAILRPVTVRSAR